MIVWRCDGTVYFHSLEGFAFLNLLIWFLGSLVSMQQHNTQLVVDMVRQQFKKNMHEMDPDKIQKFKDE